MTNGARDRTAGIVGPEADKETGGDFLRMEERSQARGAILDAVIGVDIDLERQPHFVLSTQP